MIISEITEVDDIDMRRIADTYEEGLKGNNDKNLGNVDTTKDNQLKGKF